MNNYKLKWYVDIFGSGKKSNAIFESAKFTYDSIFAIPHKHISEVDEDQCINLQIQC